MIPDKFLKPYNPQETEERIYNLWEESGFFDPNSLPTERYTQSTTIPLNAKRFSIVMPPPNVTGVLHMGHALMLTLEDIMVRYKRMRGFKTLWLPGTDHAAIATQARVEKDIYKAEKKSRHDLGREEFLKRVEAFAKESHDTITSQIRVMGASCDWSREAYTLDEKRSLAVRTMFKMMHDDGLIYRGHRIVNWDPKGQTTISDDEIVYEERKTKLYTFRYSKDFPIPIATTRPETKLGDVGVAVHPDGKWKQYIGQTFEIPDFAGISLSIKIVGDSAVDPEFGTGAVGLTPTHSFTDWEIAGKHNLNKELVVINERAKMTDKAGPHSGKKVAEAREAVVAWLKTEELLEKEEEVAHNIATAERTGGVVEPLPKLQWFINVNEPIAEREGKTLKDLMREAVQSGDIKILPDHFEKIYFHWIDNLRDWCISRQIWYGQRIPVWYRKKAKGKNQNAKLEEEEIYVGVEAPEETGWEQDPDTLDTWFSSGLWTFSTLGWPEKTKDLEMYHPTDVLETGYEILFFWIARMVLMTKYALGSVPFRTVYLHGTVRDGQGRKMSKSLGNGIDPIDVAKKFGTDAGRMALIVGNTPGTDMNISEDKIRGYKNFANKLWNIARFVVENTKGEALEEGFSGYTERDAKLREERHAMFIDVTKDMEAYRFYMAAEKLYHDAWHTFADKILEESKKILKSGTPEEQKSRRQLLLHTLDKLLRALHPFIPFVTEEIWQLWKQPSAKDGMLMVAEWPISESL
ncbi:MAG: valine--tRNA ligase [Patescibacteria group bacterium]